MAHLIKQTNKKPNIWQSLTVNKPHSCESQVVIWRFTKSEFNQYQ